MPYPPDRPVSPLEITDPATPLAPLNLTCAHGFEQGHVDLWWSSPAELSANSAFSIVGVNIYRSFDSEAGPYRRMNAMPIQASFYRDSTRIRVVLREDVSGSFLRRGDMDPSRRWIFKVSNLPIFIQPSVFEAAVDANVTVSVDGVPARVMAVDAESGVVELVGTDSFDVVSQSLVPAIVPSSSSVVLASYRHNDKLATDLGQRVYYRVTTVALNSDNAMVETPLVGGARTNLHEIEKLDYIWREAVRRNRFILYQGGERVKVFVRKAVGTRCGCSPDTHRQAASDCHTCYGTGIVGGYDGPYDVIVAPDDAEKNIAQSNRGRSLTHSYETWTGPSPLLSQRDFVAKLNGDRYGIGPVRMPTNRGMQLQQHFSISHLDERDIRYSVPVLDVTSLRIPQTRYLDQDRGNATPMTTDRPNIPAERQIRGRTATFENTNRR